MRHEHIQKFVAAMAHPEHGQAARQLHEALKAHPATTPEGVQARTDAAIETLAGQLLSMKGAPIDEVVKALEQTFNGIDAIKGAIVESTAALDAVDAHKA